MNQNTSSNWYFNQSQLNKITIKINGSPVTPTKTPYTSYFQKSTPEILKKNQRRQESKKNIVEMLMMDGLEKLEVEDFEILQ